MDKNAPHVVTATVNGQPWQREFTDVTEANDFCGVLFNTRKMPGTDEPVADIEFRICGHVRVRFPNQGWDGPREKGAEAD